ncbi:cyclic lactone autoinducer peptide [Thermanaeromonas toyohensis ToBE]|uniref:Cyclic lactone autoinducer peptide n=1 Tax=Thermanaeromonas toyohensis ToBE TaxID=698762 RepID=A0A1W1VNK2_9FIRM|nr:cyclic lactone autoinducer peptide [Thermanaeromonas toyohensis]SMB94641.1 cyclic lactone autoinducer peptide [Thermanaeromonas toyohensis ToBE]
MWRKALAWAVSCLSLLAVLVAQSSVLPTSTLAWYQPEVPKGLRR